MSAHSKIGSRYAKAFYEILGDVNKAKETVEELYRFVEAQKASKELDLVCQSNVFGADRKRAVVEGVAEHLKLSELTKKMLVVLAHSNRLKNVKEVATSLRLIALEQSGVEPIEVAAAEDLAADERKAAEEKFSKVLGKPVDARFEKVPALLGGLRVNAGGKTYDGSLSARLASLEEQMLGGY